MDNHHCDVYGVISNDDVLVYLLLHAGGTMADYFGMLISIWKNNGRASYKWMGEVKLNLRESCSCWVYLMILFVRSVPRNIALRATLLSIVLRGENYVISVWGLIRAR